MDYDIKSIASALRNSASPVLGQSEEQMAMAAAEAEKAKAKKLADLQAQQAQIDKNNERARAMGLTPIPDVIVNGVPVEKMEAAPVTAEAAEPLGDDTKSVLIQTICERDWAAMADDDPDAKESFMAQCIASKRGAGYN